MITTGVRLRVADCTYQQANMKYYLERGAEPDKSPAESREPPRQGRSARWTCTAPRSSRRR